MDFVQCLPLAFRTQQDYNISGTNIIYYDDSGALITGGAIRYSLISHNVEDIIDQQPEVINVKDKLKDYENQISDILTFTTQALGRDQQVAGFLKATDRVEVDDYNCIINYNELLERINTRLETLNTYNTKVKNRYNYLTGTTTEYTKEYISYVDDTLNKLKNDSDDAVKVIGSFGGTFEEGVLANRETITSNYQTQLQQLTTTYEGLVSEYEVAVATYEASEKTAEDLALLEEAKSNMDRAKLILDEYKESIEELEYALDNYQQLAEIYKTANEVSQIE